MSICRGPVDTTRILAFRHPSQAELLLESLASSKLGLGQRARQVSERSELPGALQRIVIREQGQGKSWLAWVQREAHWCCVATMIPARIAGQPRPALRVTKYDASGRTVNFGIWAQLPDGTWHACAVKAGGRPATPTAR
jgi:hypothetical protein